MGQTILIAREYHTERRRIIKNIITFNSENYNSPSSPHFSLASLSRLYPSYNHIYPSFNPNPFSSKLAHSLCLSLPLPTLLEVITKAFTGTKATDTACIFISERVTHTKDRNVLTTKHIDIDIIRGALKITPAISFNRKNWLRLFDHSDISTHLGLFYVCRELLSL